jgi:uncharacterized protein YgiM (DUF1202 family)
MVLYTQEKIAMNYSYRTVIFLILLVTALVVSACGAPGGATVADIVEQAATQAGAGDDSAPSAGPANSAKATVNARSLRVRGEPSPDAVVVGGIKEGEVYDVIGLSSDGEWVQLAIPAIAGGEGWVSANYVNVQGAITEAPITEAPITEAPITEATTTSGAGESLLGRLPTPTPSGGAAAGIAASPGTATVQTEGVRLRVRAEPSANAEIVGYVYDGEVFPVLDTTADGQWTQLGGRVGTDNVNGGWVASEYLVKN